MRALPVGALVAALLVPATAIAQDVTASVGGTTIPVGPAGTTVLGVERSTIGGEHFAVVRALAHEIPSRCGAAPVRAAAWGLLDGRWTEMAHEVLDRCPSNPHLQGLREVRARVVDIVVGTEHSAEFDTRVIEPGAHAETSPVSRHVRSGDRFGHASELLAAAPGGGAQLRLGENGDVVAARADLGTLRLAQHGARLAVSADLAASGRAQPVVTVQLGEHGAPTGWLRTPDGNGLHAVQLACGHDAEGAPVRCTRDGDRWHVEGSVALDAGLFRTRVQDAVQVYVSADVDGPRAVATSDAGRFIDVALAAPVDVLLGAAGETVATCAGGLMGRMSRETAAAEGIEGLDGLVVTCGQRCAHGVCEHRFGAGPVASRLEWLPAAGGGTCVRGTGLGNELVNGCRNAGSARVLGAVHVQGFDLVLGVERAWSRAGVEERQPELWALVTATAHWQRLWIGTPMASWRPVSTSVRMDGGRPTFCRADGRCEAPADLLLAAPESRDESVTGSVVAALRTAGFARPMR